MSDAERNHTIKATHLFATLGSITEHGGRITDATSTLKIEDLPVALVGDTVTYEDGRTATIIDGSGSVAISRQAPFALVGSRLNNGDRITHTLQTRNAGVTEYFDTSIEGLFDPSYVSPALEPCA